MNASFFRDREFFKEVISLALPIAFLQLITASLNMVDVLLVGQLGEAAIAALGLSNQLFFLLSLFVFGVTSGMAIFTAQYWGRRDVENIRKVLGISLMVSAGVAAVLSAGAAFFPEKILGVYTADPEVIRLGASYLRPVGLSYILTAITASYGSVLRTIHRVRLAVGVSVFALVFKTALSYPLIFGYFGLPALGVAGAGYATTVARALECGVLIFLVYRLKTPLAAPIRALIAFDRAYFLVIFRTAMPAAVNEIFWSLGITTYNAVYAHIGTQSIAAINITSTVENLAFVVFIGLANACAVMVGNRIGAGERELAYEYGRRYLILAASLILFVGGLVLATREQVIHLYQISPVAADYVRRLLGLFTLSLLLRVNNLMLFIGILRAGGDTRYCLLLESLAMWLIGVPAAFFAAFVLNLPVYGVYLFVLIEELVKLIFVVQRYRSRLWIHDLVGQPVAAPAA